MKKHASPPVLTETLSVRLPLSAFRSLVERAKSESRTLSNLVRVLLEQESSSGGPDGAVEQERRRDDGQAGEQRGLRRAGAILAV
jgi:hypothetical protein